jgi:hypothetical protein
MTTTHNPLTSFYRSPKLYVKIPSNGLFYTPEIVDLPDNHELAVFAMTAKDEMIMKNPDALLNGEAVAQVIASCVPAVLQPKKLISNDVDALLVAIQGATYGDDIDIKTSCTKCKEPVSGVASIETALETMTMLNETYKFKTHNGLTVEIKPFSYDAQVKAGIASFKSTRSLQILSGIQDELEQLRAFNDNFMQIAALNFELIVDSVASVTGQTPDGEEFIVTDKKSISEFLENSESTVGKSIEEKITEINSIGVNKKILLTCESCSNEFEYEIGFDPVNFSTAS